MIVNKSELGEFLGVSHTEVARYVREGLPCVSAGKRGVATKIDSVIAVKWLIDRAVLKELGEGEHGGRTATDEKMSLIREQTRKLQFENEKSIGLLVDVESVREFVTTVAVIWNGQLDGAAGRIAGGDAALRARLLIEHRRIREACADRLEAFARGLGPDTTEPDTTEPRAVAVGGG